MGDAEIQGGPGWVIGPDLRPRITDAADFRRGMSGDVLVDVIEALWSGEPERALRLLGTPTTMRSRALRADCLSALGDTAAARDEYDQLMREAEGTPREAVMCQHRGKVLLAAGESEAAAADFTRALELRRDAAPSLRASTEQALRVARQRVDEKRSLH